MPQDTTAIAHSGFQPNHAHIVGAMIQLEGDGYQQDTCPMPVLQILKCTPNFLWAPGKKGPARPLHNYIFLP